MNKLYSGSTEEMEGSYSIVAPNSNVAKKDFYKFCKENSWEDTQWIDIKIKLCKDYKKLDFTKLGVGVLEDDKDYVYLLSQGIINCMCEFTCPRCNHEETTVYYESPRGIFCDECDEYSDEELKKRELNQK